MIAAAPLPTSARPALGRHALDIVAGLGFVLLVAAPLAIYPVFLMKVLCFALFACAFNLLLGFGGLLSFGHAAFFGMAGYVAGHASKVWGFPFELALILASLTSALLGLVIGWLAIRRQGIYFAMITLALAQMVYFVCLQAPFTGGEDGLHAILRGSLLGILDLADDTHLYFVVLAIFVAGFLAVRRIVSSPFGQVLRAVRDNEPRAISLGFEVQRIKLTAFVLSAAIAGVAGGLKAVVFRLASLSDVHWSMSGEVVLMTLLGGVGTVLGPVAGAALVVTMQTYLASFGGWVLVIQGAIFIAVVLFLRRGLVGEFAHRFRLSA